MRLLTTTLLAALLVPAVDAQLLGFDPQGVPGAPPPPPTYTPGPTPVPSAPSVTWSWKKTTLPVQKNGQKPTRFDLVKDTPNFRDLGAAGDGAPSMSFGMCRLVDDWLGEKRDGKRLREFTEDTEGREKAMKMVHTFNDDMEHIPDHGPRTRKKDFKHRQIFRALRKDVRENGVAYFTFLTADMELHHTVLAYAFEEGLAQDDEGRVERATRFHLYDPAIQPDEENVEGIRKYAYLIFLKDSKQFAFPREYLIAYVEEGITIQERSTFWEIQPFPPFSLRGNGWTELLNHNQVDKNLPADGKWDWEAKHATSGHISTPTAIQSDEIQLSRKEADPASQLE